MKVFSSFLQTKMELEASLREGPSWRLSQLRLWLLPCTIFTKTCGRHSRPGYVVCPPFFFKNNPPLPEKPGTQIHEAVWIVFFWDIKMGWVSFYHLLLATVTKAFSFPGPYSHFQRRRRRILSDPQVYLEDKWVLFWETITPEYSLVLFWIIFFSTMNSETQQVGDHWDCFLCSI